MPDASVALDDEARELNPIRDTPTFRNTKHDAYQCRGFTKPDIRQFRNLIERFKSCGKRGSKCPLLSEVLLAT